MSTMTELEKLHEALSGGAKHLLAQSAKAEADLPKAVSGILACIKQVEDNPDLKLKESGALAAIALIGYRSRDGEVDGYQQALVKCGATIGELGDEIFRLQALAGLELDWHIGPARGGKGTAGEHNGISWWDSDDQLLIIIETNKGLEIACVYIDADEEYFEVRDCSTGDAYDDWGPESWSWWAKLPKDFNPWAWMLEQGLLPGVPTGHFATAKGGAA